MTQQELRKKWKGVDIDGLPVEKLREYKNDCFEMYEQDGFETVFYSPYDSQREHEGMRFSVVRRATEKECDLEAMPLWLVRFSNGDKAFCYPEEITKKERKFRECFKDVGSLLLDNKGKVIEYRSRPNYLHTMSFYKDLHEFYFGKGICYISDAGFKAIQPELEAIDAKYRNTPGAGACRREKMAVYKKHGWTRSKLVRMCGGKGFEKVANSIIRHLDGEEPMDIAVKLNVDGRVRHYDYATMRKYGLSRKLVKKAFGKDYFRKSDKSHPCSAALETFREKVIASIDRYHGKGIVVLKTGQTAVNYDDSWLVVGTGGNPYLRNKKLQKLVETGVSEEGRTCFDDYPLTLMSTEDLCELADKLSL